jgi:hypothetical protein
MCRKQSRPNYKRSRRYTSRRGWDHLRCADCEGFCTSLHSLRKQRADEELIRKTKEAYADHVAKQYEHRQVTQAACLFPQQHIVIRCYFRFTIALVQKCSGEEIAFQWPSTHPVAAV